jgi:hypothetical protein
MKHEWNCRLYCCIACTKENRVYSRMVHNTVYLCLFTKLWIVCLLGTLSSWNLHRNFRVQFPDHISHKEIHTALKYTAPWCTTLFINCNWEQMANGDDNCCLLLTNHKQTPTHEPHCSPCNIIPSSGPHVNYFPSFRTLSADSSAKFVCGRQHTGRCEVQSCKLIELKTSLY